MTLQQQHPPLCRQCWQVFYFNKLAKQSSAQISGRKHSPAHTAVPFCCSSAMMCCKAPTQQRCRQGSCCLSLPLPCLCVAPHTPALLRLQHHLDSSIALAPTPAHMLEYSVEPTDCASWRGRTCGFACLWVARRPTTSQL